jgi:hypothetical protein
MSQTVPSDARERREQFRQQALDLHGSQGRPRPVNRIDSTIRALENAYKAGLAASDVSSGPDDIQDDELPKWVDIPSRSRDQIQRMAIYAARHLPDMIRGTVVLSLLRRGGCRGLPSSIDPERHRMVLWRRTGPGPEDLEAFYGHEQDVVSFGSLILKPMVRLGLFRQADTISYLTEEGVDAICSYAIDGHLHIDQGRVDAIRQAYREIAS